MQPSNQSYQVGVPKPILIFFATNLLRSRITHESTSTYFQWGHLVLLKGQQEETTVRYKESGCDILALFE